MARIFITGSTEGLGRAAAQSLLDDGHEVVLHARNPSRAADLGELADRGAGVVIGDLSSAEETHAVAAQVNTIGRMDAVIHNAGIYIDPRARRHPRRTRAHPGRQRSRALPADRRDRASRQADLPQQRPAPRRRRVLARHRLDLATMGRSTGLRGQQALRHHPRFSLSRRWPMSAATSSARAGYPPGWADRTHRTTSSSDTPRRCGWRSSDEPDATVTGGYWYHRRRQAPATAVSDLWFQDALLEQLSRLTGVHLP